MTEEKKSKGKAQHQDHSGAEQQSHGDDAGASEVQEAVAEAQEKGYYGEKVDPYDEDEYTATGNQGRKAAEDRAKQVIERSQGGHL